MVAREYALESIWRPLLKDLGIAPADVLWRAGLPEDLLTRSSVRLPAEAFYRFWRSFETELGDPLFPLRVGETLQVESFSPPLFAALCSPDFVTACERIARYKPLIAPFRLSLLQERDSVALTLTWPEDAPAPPRSLILAELVFFIHLIRLATREPIQPLSVTTRSPPEETEAYARFFGVPVQPAPRHSLRFAEVDARRPFLTANEGMWMAFEPELRRRLAELDASATVAERVRAALLECLPSGRVSMDAVARRLAVSKRTLQRRLSKEETTFQKVLQDTREALARHYLQRTDLATAEISFLLGFEEPNSFYRAFSDWTGSTPDHVRRTALH